MIWLEEVVFDLIAMEALDLQLESQLNEHFIQLLGVNLRHGLLGLRRLRLCSVVRHSRLETGWF